MAVQLCDVDADYALRLFSQKTVVKEVPYSYIQKHTYSIENSDFSNDRTRIGLPFSQEVNIPVE